MTIIRFTGAVIPVPVPSDAGLDDLAPIPYEDIVTGDKEKYSVKIIDDQVSVLIELTNFSDEDVERHRNKSLDLARAALDLYNFRVGWGLTLYLDRYINPEGTPVIIVPGHSELSKIVTFGSGAIKSLYPIFAADKRLHIVMNDLIMAITWPHVAAVNCARAVEGIRTIIAPGKRSAGWPIMREALNLDESYTRRITDISEAPRHGQPTWNNATSIEAVITSSWTIMMRYMDWESRGEIPLPLDLFPLLS